MSSSTTPTPVGTPKIIAQPKWNYCTINDCVFKCIKTSQLSQHITQVHEINVTWILCEIEDCDYRCKRICDLKIHQAFLVSLP